MDGALGSYQIRMVVIRRDILIGTHSREIEGRLFEYLLGAGWLLEMERPALLTLHAGAPIVTVDGVQGWRNPRLLPL